MNQDERSFRIKVALGAYQSVRIWSGPMPFTEEDRKYLSIPAFQAYYVQRHDSSVLVQFNSVLEDEFKNIKAAVLVPRSDLDLLITAIKAARDDAPEEVAKMIAERGLQYSDVRIVTDQGAQK